MIDKSIAASSASTSQMTPARDFVRPPFTLKGFLEEIKMKLPLLPDGSLDPVVMTQKSIKTYLQLIVYHGFPDRMRYNVLKNRAEIMDEYDEVWRAWTDEDESYLKHFIQSRYGLYNKPFLEDCLRLIWEAKKVDPLKDLLESLHWDGKERIATFLIKTVGCPDTPYYREAARLIFAEGIARAYDPGCKCDDMVVLMGNQGCGKSTLVQWLNMNKDFYGEVKTVSGKEAIEALAGVWIGEMGELIAMKNVKDIESVKAFITSRWDSYRKPYARYKTTLPRRCIFVGTTNNRQFLHDKTGNRRFYPVECVKSGNELFKREAEIREEIRQCWAEAVYKYKAGMLPAYADPSLKAEYLKHQQDAMEDDWRAGMIEDYLDQKRPGERVSVIEIWYRALKMDENLKPTRRDSIEINQIIEKVPGWIRESSPRKCAYGTQRHFVKVATLVKTPEECPW